MKLLVTGGAGFIGANFVHFVLAESADTEIVVVDALTYAGNLANLAPVAKHPHFRFIQGDIRDEALVDRLVSETDAVVHFAAESHVDRSIVGPRVFIETNVLGTFTLLEAVRKYKRRFHHVSTDEVYGSLAPTDPPFTEDSSYDPRSPYSASKAASDHLVRAAVHTYGVAATISNTSNNYGPYHFPEKLIPLAITELLDGKKVPLYGDGLQIRDWIHVRDHCRGVWLALTQGKLGETYCFGGQSERTNLSVIQDILRTLDLGEEYITFVTDRLGHDRRYAIDSTKAKRELGWVPEVQFADGLRETVRWYEDHRAWWESVKSGAYRNITLDERLPV